MQNYKFEREVKNTVDWGISLRRQRSTLDCSTIEEGEKGRRKRRRRRRRRR
jgi:hypothetical protein